jgi:hypothetical protein
MFSKSLTKHFRVLVADLPSFTQNLMQTRCSILLSIADKMKHEAEKASCLDHFTSRESTTRTQQTAVWMGPRTCMDTLERRKLVCPCLEWSPESSVVQPIA